eukprot:g751.t1
MKHYKKAFRLQRKRMAAVRAPGQPTLTLIEKIARKCAVQGTVAPRHFVQIKPKHVMTHDNTAAVMKKFGTLGVDRVHSARQIVFTLDHNVQDKSEGNLRKYASIANFAMDHGIDAYPAGRGIGHQVMVEEGYVLPGSMVVASDSHSNMYGGLGCLGTPIVRTDAAGIWATGQTWWQVPRIARVTLSGRLDRSMGATSKDIIIALCGVFNNDEVLNHAIEFDGEGVSELSVDERLTIANMTTEWGALAGVFPADESTFEWLERRATVLRRRGNTRLADDVLKDLRAARERGDLCADKGASYDIEMELDLSTVRPFVSGPNHVKRMRSVTEIEKERIPVDKAYIVSCVNSRVEDLAAAADVVRSMDASRRRVANGVELYIAAASSEVEKSSRERGDWQVLLDAGARPLPPGCGPCVGLGAGLLQENEVAISATNRNFKGRMGARSAHAYLGSPAVVAASALSGYISGPNPLRQSGAEHGGSPVEIVAKVGAQRERGVMDADTELADGFPEKISGPLIFCQQDNLDTDGIFAGTHTYKENLGPADMANVVMENYDPTFSSLVQPGDILLAGSNFGCGSSREQAATALKCCGVDIVLAGSFSETYKRNGFNNGLMCVEAPELLLRLPSLLSNAGVEERPTIRTDLVATLDFASSTISVTSQEDEEDSSGDEAMFTC